MSDVTILQGDVLERLPELETNSVNAVVTSPPYWRLRDYGHDLQLGQEPTLERWVANLVQVFSEVARVMRDDGTLWLELGDRYVKKQLSGAPWRLAMALSDAGWLLRSEVIWHKPNAMPSSAKDRPTIAHSSIFMLTRSPRYYFDQDAVRVPHKTDGRKVTTVKQGPNSHQHRNGERWPNGGRNIRTVWKIPTQPLPFKTQRLLR